MEIQTKRIYAPPAPTDGWRVLVDRLWPRGVSKQRAQLNAWLKDVAPSPQLRIWFGHKPENFEEFKQKYWLELKTDPAKQPALQEIRQQAETQPVTLLFAAKSPTINHAVVLQQFLLGNG